MLEVIVPVVRVEIRLECKRQMVLQKSMLASSTGDKGEVTVINEGISIRARGGRPRHLAPIHYEDAPRGPAPPHTRAPPRTRRGASMQQVRAQVLSCKEFRKTI